MTIGDIAKWLYQHANEAKILHGKPHGVVVGICIFIACRQAHVPRSQLEVADFMRVSRKTLGRCVKTLASSFDLATQGSIATATSAEKLLVRYCNHLDLSPNVQSIYGDVISAARKLAIADGRSPVSIAGGAIYHMCNLFGRDKSLLDICAVAGITENTMKEVQRLNHAQKAKLIRQE